MAHGMEYYKELIDKAQELKKTLINTKQEIATKVSEEMLKDADNTAAEVIAEKYYGHYRPDEDHYKRLGTLYNAVNINTTDDPKLYGIIPPDEKEWFISDELNGHRASNDYILNNSFYEGYHGGPVYGITLKDKNGNNYWTSKINGKRVSAGKAGDPGMPPIMEIPLAVLIPREVENMLDRNDGKYKKIENEIVEKRLSKFF